MECMKDSTRLLERCAAAVRGQQAASTELHSRERGGRMRWSQYYLFTTREVPNDAEVISHQLMVRTGMIKKVAAGIYSYLPFGWRSLQKLMAIVRREMDAAGAHRAARCRRSSRPSSGWSPAAGSSYGKELLRIKDRHDREFCFGPTHEEVITDIVRRDVKSYRQLPFNLYQIQTKFRDEIRPRFGLMRGREFLMKDAYSFHAERREPRRGLRGDATPPTGGSSRPAASTTRWSRPTPGTIGGSASHEFMVVAATGESAVVRCPSLRLRRQRREGRDRGRSRRRGRRAEPRTAMREVRDARA